MSNNANRPNLLLYLDSLGNEIEKIGYGKHHNSDLRLLDFVEQNNFENGRLASTIIYNTDYCKNISANFKIIYSYNNINQLIQEKEFFFGTDSLFMQFDYEYDTNGNKTKTIYFTILGWVKTLAFQAKFFIFATFKIEFEWTDR